MDIHKLELSTETIRELNDDELTHVAGGQNPVPPLTGNETYYCPIIGPRGVTHDCFG